MRLFVLILFWTYVLVVIVDLVTLKTAHYPRQREPRSLGADLAEVFIGFALINLMAWLLWA